jgi:hypothetical protein
LAFSSFGQSYAGQYSISQAGSHSPFFHEASCRFGVFNNCFGPDRDLLVDRLYRVTCAEAKNMLEHRGFTRVKTVSCGGASYKFTGRWKNKSYALRVSRSTGDLLSMKRVK